jgi:acetate---CoA ligase (ADP-forming)
MGVIPGAEGLARDAVNARAERLPPIDLRPLFAPRSIAVVGASPRNNLAQTVRDNLLRMGSATTCHFVNPRYTEAWGSPCYPSLEALPEPADLVLLAVGPGRVTPIVAEAAQLGIPAAVVVGGGVVEGGELAATMQREVAEIALRHGMAMLGPNCMGLVDFTANAAAYIGDVSPWLRRGGVAAIAQSGSVADAFIHSGNRIGFSRIVSSGADVVLDVCDHLAYSLDDPETHAVILFVEGFRRPERFLALADRALALGKPILAVKVGRSDHAREAALAHSGSLAGEDRVADAAFEAAGIIRCADLDELLEAAELVDGCRRIGRGVGRGRTGVVTVSTGEAGLIADLAPRLGLDLPPVPDPAREAIATQLPTMGFIANPLDPWGAADAPVAYRAAFEAFAASGAYDVLAAVHDFPYRSLVNEVEVAIDVAAALIAATEHRPHLLPVYVSLTSGEPTPEVKDLLDRAGGAPLLRGATAAFGAIAGAARWERFRRRRTDEGPWRAEWPELGRDRTPAGHDEAEVPGHRVIGRRVLAERESLELLATVGIPVVASRAVADALGAAVAAQSVGYPVALKLDVEGLAHKSDIGGVALDLTDEPSLLTAAERLLAAARATGLRIRGLLVQPMAPAGQEILVGMRRDPLFGPAVVVGLGGILAEALDDVAVSLAPVDDRHARSMLDRLRGGRLLESVRGRPGVDRDALARMIVAVGRLGVDRPDILEVDLNPVIAGPTGALAVDALVVLED